jgi:hypothetical protein
MAWSISYAVPAWPTKPATVSEAREARLPDCEAACCVNPSRTPKLARQEQRNFRVFRFEISILRLCLIRILRIFK